MKRLLNQIFRRPVAALVSSFELLGQRINSDQQIDGIVSRVVHTLSRTSSESDKVEHLHLGPTAELLNMEALVDVQPDTYFATHDESVQELVDHGDLERSESTAFADAHQETSEATRRREERVDTELRNEMLKLVRYQVLFVRREYEHAFAEKEALIVESLDCEAFTAWKIAEFMQELSRGETPVPERWLKKNYPPQECVCNSKLIDLPPEDRKYLRLQYSVMECYQRARFNHKKRQIRVLKQIRDEIVK